MLLDKQLEFSSEQAVTATAGSTNVVALGDGGLGVNDLNLVISVDEAATADGAATVTFALQSDDSADFDDDIQTLWTSSAIGKASLTTSYKLQIPVPHTSKKYMRVYYTVATGPLTAGKFTAGLTNSGELTHDVS